MYIQNNNNYSEGFFQNSDQQAFRDLLEDLGIINDKQEIVESALEFSSFIAQPNQKLLDLFCKPYDVEYHHWDYSRKEPFSLFQLYLETQLGRKSHFYVVGKSLFYLFGYAGFVEFLQKITIKKSGRSLWELLPQNLKNVLEKQCNRLGNGVDLCIYKEAQESDTIETYFEHVHQFLLRMLTPSKEKLFLQNFSDQYAIVNHSKKTWTLQKFFHGHHTIYWQQFANDPHFYRQLHEAMRLKIHHDEKEITGLELQADTPLQLLESLLSIILKISRKCSDSEDDLCLLLKDQTHFMVSVDEGDDSSIAQEILKGDKQKNTYDLYKMIDSTYKYHCTKDLSALTCLVLNALRICLPYINENQLIAQLQDVFSKHTNEKGKQSFVYRIAGLLLKKVGFEKLCAAIQVASFAALHAGVPIDNKKIAHVLHRKHSYIQIGTEHCFLLKWEVEKALVIVEEHFGTISSYLPTCLNGLIESPLSAREIVFIAAHHTRQFKLAARFFSELKGKSPYVPPRILSNPFIPGQDKLLHILNMLSVEKDRKQQEELLIQLNELASTNEKLLFDLADHHVERIVEEKKRYPNLFARLSIKDKIIHSLNLLTQEKEEKRQEELLVELNQLAVTKEKIQFKLAHRYLERIVQQKERYPHLFLKISLEKIQTVWIEQYKGLKNNSEKLNFFVQVIKMHQLYRFPCAANWLEDKPSLEVAKINTQDSYIDLLGDLFVNRVAFEQIYALIQVVFFATVHEPLYDENPAKCQHRFKQLQIGNKENFVMVKIEIGKALEVCKNHFDILGQYLCHPKVSTQEILFIAAHHAGENKHVLRLFRTSNLSETIAKRLLHNFNIPFMEKLNYVLELLKQEPKELALFLSYLNTLLSNFENKISLTGKALEHVKKNWQEYPHIVRLLPKNIQIVKELPVEVKIVSQTEIVKETVPLTEPVKPQQPKQPIKTQPVKTKPTKVEPVKTKSTKAEPVKTEPVKKQPSKTQPIKKQPKTWENFLKEENYKDAFSVFKYQLTERGEKMLKSAPDTLLSQLFLNVSLEAFKTLDWELFRLYLPKEKTEKTRLAIDERLNALSQQVGTVQDIVLIRENYSKPRELLLSVALQVKDNVKLSCFCFGFLFQMIEEKTLDTKISLYTLFSAYSKKDDLIWLLSNVKNLHDLFGLNPSFKKFLEHIMSHLKLGELTHQELYKASSALLFINMWTPALVSHFSCVCALLRKDNKSFNISSHEEDLKELFSQVDSLNDLYEFSFFCFSYNHVYLPIFLINRLIELLNKNTELRKEKLFLELFPKIKSYLEKWHQRLLKEGATKEKWKEFSNILSEFYYHYSCTEDKEKVQILSDMFDQVMLFSVLCEEDSQFFSELIKPAVFRTKENSVKNFMNLLWRVMQKVAGYIEKMDQFCNDIALYKKKNAQQTQATELLQQGIDKRLDYFYLEVSQRLLEVLASKQSDVTYCLDVMHVWAVSQWSFQQNMELPALTKILSSFLNKLKQSEKLSPENTKKLLELIVLQKIVDEKNILEGEEEIISQFKPEEASKIAHIFIENLTNTLRKYKKQKNICEKLDQILKSKKLDSLIFKN